MVEGGALHRLGAHPHLLQSARRQLVVALECRRLGTNCRWKNLSPSFRRGAEFMISRKIAVAIPALNEAERIVACLTALLKQRLDAPRCNLSIVVLANNCTDETAATIRARFSGGPIEVREVSLIAPHNHAGWARRLSIEAAVERLDRPTDILMCTDADTVVAPDWIARNLAHIDSGFEAVAGFAMPLIAEWRRLLPAHRSRFNRLRKYHTLLAFLRRDRHGLAPDPWPRHEYEGGASIAMTLGLYHRLGELQTPPVGEDKALFEAFGRAGARIRHPLDVRVFTSCRFHGRASGGMADTIAEWGRQDEDAPIHGAWPLNVELGHVSHARSHPLTFRTLDEEIAKAQMLVRSDCGRWRLDISA
jgi:Glycosyl transferase family 2